MVKTIDINVDGTIFKVQEGMSFTQRAEFMQRVSSVMDRDKLAEAKEVTIASCIKKDLDPIKISIDLFKYMLLTFVVNPKITQETLDNPDDLNSDNYMVLGAELLKLAMESVAKSQLLKKAPMK